MKRTNLQSCLRRLEELEQLATTAPGLLGWKMFDEEQFFVLLLQLRNDIPEEIAAAIKVEFKTQAILNDARRRADEMLRAAHREAAQLRDNAALFARQHEGSAQENAKRINELAIEQSQSIVVEAEEKAWRLFEEHSITVQAIDSADRMRDNALKERGQFVGEVNRYADAMLAQTAMGIGRLRLAVAKARDEINGQLKN